MTECVIHVHKVCVVSVGCSHMHGLARRAVRSFKCKPFILTVCTKERMKRKEKEKICNRLSFELNEMK